MKITGKLILPIILLVIIGMSVLIFFSYNMSNESLFIANSRLSNLAKNAVATEIEQLNEFNILNVISYSQTAFFKPYLDGGHEGRVVHEADSRGRVVNAAETYSYARVGLADIYGTILVDSNNTFEGKNIFHEPFFKKALEGEISTGTPYFFDGKMVYTIASPVYSSKSSEVIGVVFIVSFLGEEEMIKNLNLEKGDQFFIADNIGHIFVQNDTENSLDMNLHDLMIGQRVMSEKSGSFLFNDKGVEKYASFSFLSGLNWYVVIINDVFSIEADSRKIGTNSIFITVLVAGIISLIIVLIARKIVHAVKLIAKFTTYIASGKFGLATVYQEEYENILHRKDEFSDLAINLVTMADNLEKSEKKLVKHNTLLHNTIQVIQYLLNESDNFNETIHLSLKTLGRATDADAVRIWRIHKSKDPNDTNQYTTAPLYEWSSGAVPRQDNESFTITPVSKVILTWVNTFLSGNCLNSLVKNLPQTERNQLESHGIVSLIITPIMLHGELWGAICFNNCHAEYVWSEAEEDIIRMVGTLITTAINNRNTNIALQEARERSLIAEDATGEIIWTIDANYKLTYISNRIEQLLQYTSAELEGKEFSALLFNGQDSKNEPFFAGSTPKNPISRDVVAPFRCKDGSTKWLKSSSKCIFDKEGKRLHTTGSSLDITEIHLAQIALSDANEQLINSAKIAEQLADEAEKANSVKGEFLATMSHEIRTPLNGILGLLHLLSDMEDRAVQQDYLQKVLFSAESLLRIINDILDFSKIEAGKFELEKTPFTLINIVNKLNVVFNHTVKDKGLSWQAYQDEFADVQLIGDPLRLEQVLINLLGNAIKFTEKGGVTLTVKCKKEDDGQVCCLFSVQDTGIGLSKEQQKRLFSAFTQVDSTITRKYGGTGLGLAISKQLVELMGGQIWVEGELGVGSTFFFTAVFDEGDKDHIESKEIKTIEYTQKEGHILLVEDNEINQLVAEELLKKKGYTVDIANNGEEALTALDQAGTQYDLILMDIQMPVMDGFVATKKIRESEQYKHLPIIALSANAMSEDRTKSLDHGMNDHIAKPIDPNTLFAKLDMWIDATKKV